MYINCPQHNIVAIVIVKRYSNQIAAFTVCCYLTLAFRTVSCVHTGGNTVEINTEAASSDITEYPPPDDKPNAGMFGFLCCYIVCIHLVLPHIQNIVEVVICCIQLVWFMMLINVVQTATKDRINVLTVGSCLRHFTRHDELTIYPMKSNNEDTCFVCNICQ